jgi:hypothetical protein
MFAEKFRMKDQEFATFNTTVTAEINLEHTVLENILKICKLLVVNSKNNFIEKTKLGSEIFVRSKIMKLRCFLFRHLA